MDTAIWKPSVAGERIMQGYLSTDKKRVVRVRTKGDKAYLTIKGANEGIKRPEFEYEIPFADAEQILQLSKDMPIEKTRYTERHAGKIWEIDVFEKANKGLVLAEVELQHENEKVEIPDWATGEVSSDKRYFNAWLSEHPYTKW